MRGRKNRKPEITLTAEEKARFRKRYRNAKIGHFFAYFFTVIAAVVLCFLLVVSQLFIGPSQTISDQLTNTLMETSALTFVPYLYLTEDQVAAARERGKVVVSGEETDVSLIHIPETITYQETEKDIEVIEIHGSTYRGYLMIVRDPSRVTVGVCASPFGDKKPGLTVPEYAEKYQAVAVLNGGGFYDPQGGGNGGSPRGIIASGGEILTRSNNAFPTVMGFDQDDILHVGNFTVDQCKELGIRDAVSFGPALIVNGEPAQTGSGAGLNPRSAIGQRADGAVLLLAIDGRKANSLGATVGDLVNIMMEYGAVNAGNLDGGSSTALWYNGEQLNDGVPLIGSRQMPSAWIVH